MYRSLIASYLASTLSSGMSLSVYLCISFHVFIGLSSCIYMSLFMFLLFSFQTCIGLLSRVTWRLL